jgi:hypothetical protein
VAERLGALQPPAPAAAEPEGLGGQLRALSESVTTAAAKASAKQRELLLHVAASIEELASASS